jgi:hypothetical protein
MIVVAFVWMARGFGGQNLMVFPQEGLIVTFTASDILGTKDPEHEFVTRVLVAVRAKSCGALTLLSGTSFSK